MRRTYVEAPRSKWQNSLALRIMAAYSLPTAVLPARTWHNTKPEYLGMDWILVSLLTFPFELLIGFDWACCRLDCQIRAYIVAFFYY